MNYEVVIGLTAEDINAVEEMRLYIARITKSASIAASTTCSGSGWLVVKHNHVPFEEGRDELGFAGVSRSPGVGNNGSAG